MRELAFGLANDDRKAWEDLYKMFFDSVHTFVSRIVKSPDDAADIAQEVFITLWHNRAKVDPDKNIGGYIYAIIRTLAFRFIRQRNKQSGNSSLSEIPEPSLHDVSPDEILAADEMKILIALSLEGMPPMRRQVFEMSREQGMSNDEIAKALNIGKRTVESHIYNATKELKELVYLAVMIIAPGGTLYY